MTPTDDEFYVMPKSQWNDGKVHHPAPEATREDPTPLCDAGSDDIEVFRVADETDRDRYGLCSVCAAKANDEPDPRGNHDESGRSPADVLRENGFELPEDSTGGST
ncbi:hypothetical protein G9463_18760 [Haloarcula sp. JP-Z28]|uniref:hypothetical protein n=1 Tax=Haloarcula sp. JP-Z28 TaxID=2716715 RepID=UPI0014045807|nr:hypothetical protein [Haloarcula sp. JP-Z28]NHN65326.1 hypothetical protein [Haloarcula sp. JP-Z28]